MQRRNFQRGTVGAEEAAQDILFFTVGQVRRGEAGLELQHRKAMLDEVCERRQQEEVCLLVEGLEFLSSRQRRVA